MTRIVGRRLRFSGNNRSLGRWEAPERGLPPQQLPHRPDDPHETVNRLFQLIQPSEIDDGLARPLQLARNHGLDPPFQIAIDCWKRDDIKLPLHRCATVVVGARTVAKMFVNNATGQRGLVCQYDIVCFDEISGISFDQKDGVNIMKGYMASGQFSRGKENICAEGSGQPIGWTKF